MRELTRRDVPAVVALEVELFGPSAWTPAMVSDELEGPGRRYVGIDGPDGLVAYAGTWYDGDVVQVMTIGVGLAAQRRGLGRTLLADVVAHARSLHAAAVLLEVRVDNDAALALYEGAGFERLARRRRYYQPEDVDAWTMRLVLSDG